MKIVREGLLTACSLLFLATAAGAAPAPIDLPGEKLHPESVSITPDGTAYISSMGGGVVRASLKTGKAEQWIAPGAFGSGAQFGVFADTKNKLLWTCTNDFSARGVTVAGSDAGSVIKAFDLKTGKGKLSLPMPGDKPVCNDFAVAKDGTVYVTDTAHPLLLRWRPGATALEVWAQDPVLGGGIDGIAIGGDGAIYLNNVRNGDLFRIDVAAGGTPGKVTKLTPSRPLTSPDGMRSMGGSTLVVAESKGQITLVTVKGDQAEVQTLAEGITSPTGVDAHGGAVWYVQAQLGWLFSGGKAGTAPTLPFRLTPVPLPK
jgi:sugar lactone lactonase YvrE